MILLVDLLRRCSLFLPEDWSILYRGCFDEFGNWVVIVLSLKVTTGITESVSGSY